MTSYLTLIETMRLSCTVFELLSLISQNLKTSRDRDHAHSRAVCNPNAKESHGEPVHKNLKCLFSRSGDILWRKLSGSSRDMGVIFLFVW